MSKHIYLTGLNHRTAGVEVREQYALTDLEAFEEGVVKNCRVRECMALSTCNRVEILCVSDHGPEENVLDEIVAHWAQQCGGDGEALGPHIYRHHNLEAVHHLFTVASSLDSMVMGEPQILGQLKDAYRSAVDKGTAKVIVNRLLHKSFSVAKRVRTETAVASSAVSISFAAVELARRIFGDLTGKSAMLIGAGEMAELAATHLLHNGVEKLLIANRTYSRAKELAARLHGGAVQFEQLTDWLPEADIVISSTGSPVAILHARDMRTVLKARKHKPMFFIDIAVPRDIDPDVNQLDNVYLYDIDDLKEVVEENLAQRREEAVKARELVDLETEAFGIWLKSLKLQPTIVSMIDQAEDIAERELAKTIKRLGDVDEETREALHTLVTSIVGKVLHEPICYLKRRAREEQGAEQIIDTARKFFRLDGQTLPPRAHGPLLDDDPLYDPDSDEGRVETNDCTLPPDEHEE